MSGIITSGVERVMCEPQTKTIEIVIFQNLIRVNLSPNYIGGDVCQSLVFPASDVPSTTISYEILLGLYAKYRPEFNLSILAEHASEHAELMNDALKEYPKEIQEILRSDILDLTYYFRYNLELWDITQLCLKYDIAPVDVFVALVADASPYGMGAFEFPKTGNYGLAEKARADFQEKLNSSEDSYWFRHNEIYFDYWNGIGVKSGFPKNINTNPMQVNIHRYNERNEYQGYYRIIKLFATRLSSILAVEQHVSEEPHVTVNSESFNSEIQ